MTNVSNISSIFQITTTEHDSIVQDLRRVFCEFKLCSDPRDPCANVFPDVFEKVRQLTDPPKGPSLPSTVLLTFIYSLITLMSLVGNSLVITTFALDKNMRSVTNVFILSLAAADLMVTVACIPFNLGSVFTSYWIFGKFACKLVPTFMTFSVACSSLTLCSIALDRYVAIVHPHKLKFLQNAKPASLFLALVWIVSLLCSIPNAIFYDLIAIETKCRPLDGKTNYICLWPDNPYKIPLEIWLTLIFLFIVPFLIMFTTYGLIGYDLWIRKPIGSGSRTHDNMIMKKRVIQMLIMVVAVFVLCWSPIMILNAVLETGKQTSIPESIQYLKLYLQCLALVSCCCNPVIYTFMNKKFRTRFTSYLFCGKNRVFSSEVHPSQGTMRTAGGPRLSQGAMVPRAGQTGVA